MIKISKVTGVSVSKLIQKSLSKGVVPMVITDASTDNVSGSTVQYL